jgi:predicted MFS family arabinose efflux permease
MAPFALGNLLAVLQPSYWVMAAVRVVQGAALPAFVSIGSTAVARLVGPAREGRAIAQLNLGVIVAVVLVVPAGVALADRAGWPAVFLTLTALAGAAALAIGLAFAPVAPAERTSLRAQAALLRQPLFLAHLFLSAALFMAMFAAYTYLAAFLEEVAGFGGRGVAVALAAFGLAGLGGNWIAGRVVDRGATLATGAVALVLAVATAAISLSGAHLGLLVPLLGLWGAAHAAAFLLCQLRVMRAGSDAPAFAFSLNIAACNVGIGAGAAVGGAVAVRFGVDSIGHTSAALAIPALVVALLLVRRRGA